MTKYVHSREVAARFKKHDQVERDAWAKVAIEHALRMEKNPGEIWRSDVMRSAHALLSYLYISLRMLLRGWIAEIKKTDEWMAVDDRRLPVHKKKLTWRDTKL